MAGDAIDPRYDPRFQRGYDPSAEAAVPPAAPWAKPEPPAEPERPARPVGATESARVVSALPGIAPTADALTTVGSWFGTERHADPVGASVALVAETAGAAGTAEASETADPAAGVAASPESGFPAGVASSVPVEAPLRAVATRWLWLVLAASVALIVTGVAVYWQGATSQWGYAGPTNRDDAAAGMVAAAAAPALVQVGVLGVVGVLLTWALFAGRREAGTRP